MPKMEVIDSGLGDELGRLVMGLSPVNLAKSQAQAALMQSNIDLHVAQRRNVMLDTDWEEEQRKARREAGAAAGRALDAQQTSTGSAVDDPAQAARLNASKAINTAGIYTASDVIAAGYGGLGRGQAYTYGLPAGEEARRALQTATSGTMPRADVPLTDEQRRVIDREQQERDMAKLRFTEGEAAARQFQQPLRVNPNDTVYISPQQQAARPDLAPVMEGPRKLGPNEIWRLPTAPAAGGASSSTGAVPGPQAGPSAADVPSSAPPQPPGVGSPPAASAAPGGSIPGARAGQDSSTISTMGAGSNFYSPSTKRTVWSPDGQRDRAGNPLPADAIEVKDPDITKLGAAGAPDLKEIRAVRQDLAGSEEAKNYAKVLPIWNSVVQSAYQNTKADDLNTVYATASILDPGSVVREAESGMIRATASASDFWKGLLAQIEGEGALQPQTKANLLRMLDGRIGGYQRAYEAKAEQYRYIAEQNGWDVRQILPIPMERAVVDPARLNTVGPAPAGPGAPQPAPGGGTGGGAPVPTTGPALTPQGVPTTPTPTVRQRGGTGGLEISRDGGRTWEPYP